MVHGPTDSNQSNTNIEVVDDDDTNLSTKEQIRQEINEGMDSIEHLRLDQTFKATYATTWLIVWSIFENNKEYILLCCALCSMLLLTFVVYLIYKKDTRLLDKAPLVDNEVSANVDVERLTIHV